MAQDDRIQRLLKSSEYIEFQDTVLLESPFAQISKHGQGIREVHLGVTPSRIILATDYIPPKRQGWCIFQMPHLDPALTNFELISIVPLHLVTMSVHSDKRRVIKLAFCNKALMYFELGGLTGREGMWKLWKERICFLCPSQQVSGVTMSGKRVKFCSSQDILRPVTTKVSKESGIVRVVNLYGGGDGESSRYTGSVLSEKVDTTLNNVHAKPGQVDSSLRYSLSGGIYPSASMAQIHIYNSVVKIHRKKRVQPKEDPVLRVNRFGSGVSENCSYGLYLPTSQKEDKVRLRLQAERDAAFKKSVDQSLSLWEKASASRTRRLRTDRITPSASHASKVLVFQDFGNKPLMRIRRTISSPCLRAWTDSDNDDFLTTPSKHMLKSYISTQDLIIDPGCNQRLPDGSLMPHSTLRAATVENPIFFWTPGIAYCPLSFRLLYMEQKFLLAKIQPQINSLHRNSKTLSDAGFARQKLGIVLDTAITLNFLDMDSNCLAFQLTRIDCEFFIQIPECEIGSLSRGVSLALIPHLANYASFSHRVASLVATEVVRATSLEHCASVVTHWINVARQCHSIHNLHSCNSILNGLKSPAVFRIRPVWREVKSWRHVEYRKFLAMCMLFENPRSTIYRTRSADVMGRSYFLPLLSDLVSVALGQDDATNNTEKDSDDMAVITLYRNPILNNTSERVRTRRRSHAMRHKLQEPDGFLQHQKEEVESRISRATDFLLSAQDAAKSYKLGTSLPESNYFLCAKYLEPWEAFMKSLRTFGSSRRNSVQNHLH